jgi:hypothetical protein
MKTERVFTEFIHILNSELLSLPFPGVLFGFLERLIGHYTSEMVDFLFKVKYLKLVSIGFYLFHLFKHIKHF